MLLNLDTRQHHQVATHPQLVAMQKVPDIHHRPPDTLQAQVTSLQPVILQAMFQAGRTLRPQAIQPLLPT